MTLRPDQTAAERHAELQRLAEDATPGPWHCDTLIRGRTEGYEYGVFAPKDRIALAIGMNAHYIAAVSPDVVLGLLAEITALRAHAEQAGRERDEYRIEADCAMRDYDGLELSAGIMEEELAETRQHAQDLTDAIIERRCNGCKRPFREWGPYCGGMDVGDQTHFHSAEWWASRVRAALAVSSPPHPAPPSVGETG